MTTKFVYQRTLSIILMNMIPVLCFSQINIRGKVENGVTHNPVSFVNVFLSNTSKGIMSDEDGNFLLKNVPSGRYDLVISSVGYETLKINILTTDKKKYRVILKPSDEKLPVFTVKAKRGNKWKNNLITFTDNFIGLSENSNRCKIINPEVLYFYDTLNVLVAKSKDLLIIENRGLGYYIKYALVNFTFDHKTFRVSYKGYPVFEPMKAENAIENSIWIENRKKAFEGSITHFMRCLHNRKLDENCFSMHKVIERIDENMYMNKEIKYATSAELARNRLDAIARFNFMCSLKPVYVIDTVQSTSAKTVVSFDGLIKIFYYGEYESYNYQSIRLNTESQYLSIPQTSIIRMTKSTITIEPDGHFYDSDGIIFELYWSWELMAEMMPLDYGLATSNDLK